MTTPWNTYWQQEDEDELAWWKTPDPEVLELIAQRSPAEYPRALDLGCGLGRHSIALAKAGFQVTGLDLSPSGIEHLQAWAASLGLAVQTGIRSCQEELGPPGSYDLVISYNVIYHGGRADFARAIERVRSVLRPGGLFFFTAPTRQDGKYGFGREVAPHTWECEKSITPGDIHYFPDETDLDELLAGFRTRWRRVEEGWWSNQGQDQFFSNWLILVERI